MLTRSNQRIKTSRIKYKPTKLPEGFVLLIDSREQLPLFVDHRLQKGDHIILKKGLYKGLEIKCVTCPTAIDYTVEGYENQIGIERKRVSDFLSYVGKERKKTDRKREILQSMFFAGLLIEANESDLVAPQVYGGRITPEHVRGFLVSCNVRNGIHVYANRNRQACERWALDRLVKAYNVLKGDKCTSEMVDTNG